MADDFDHCYFPDIAVERVGNIALIHCKSEDDAIVVYEIFRQVSLGNPVWIGKEGADA